MNKGYRLYDHDKLYYELLDKINKEFEAGNITEEEKNVMITKATLDESELRRQDIELGNNMFNTRGFKVGEPGYYQQCIDAFLDGLYIKCIYNMDELVIASNYNFGEFVMKEADKLSDEVYEIACKKIYDDLVDGKLNMLETTGLELIKKYVGELKC